MVTLNTVKQNHYQDSMKLMQISRELANSPGIKKASAIMATEANLKTLRDAGLIKTASRSLGANDLIIAIEAESETAGHDALGRIDSFLTAPPDGVGHTTGYRSFEEALRAPGNPNIAVISVPGEFAKLEVARAIKNNIHTFLFSDNLSVDEEVELKRRAARKGLLMMGPGCGTAIINGAGFGFANIVRRGPVGIVAAAGTGMQEVASLIHNWGVGVSHGIGVGGRDLSEKVGGLMAIKAMELLEKDENTEIILLVSKPAPIKVTKKIIETARRGKKPFAMCLLGENGIGAEKNVFSTDTLEELSLLAVNLAGGQGGKRIRVSDAGLKRYGRNFVNSLRPSQKYVRGLFSGGTLCYEAQKILTLSLGKIYSNAPLSKDCLLSDSRKSRGHCCVDLGEEEFTVGRPHPMIDSTLRSERIIEEAKDPQTAVILLDIVLGYGSNADPAGELLPAIGQARQIAKNKNRSLAFIAHVCGTDDDPQNLDLQEKKLRRNGIKIATTNAQGARAAALIARLASERRTGR